MPALQKARFLWDLMGTRAFGVKSTQKGKFGQSSFVSRELGLLPDEAFGGEHLDVKTAPCRAASVGGGAKGRKEGVHFKRSRGGKRKLLGSSLDRNVSNLLRHETPLACVRLTHFWRRRPLKRAGFPLGGVSIEQLKHQGKRG